jgi:alginate O-acetyltransferase complex protein AlgI
MLFNSVDFAIFLPVVFILYWLIANKNIKFQKAVLLISNYIFYGWWDWRFLLLIGISSFTDYFVGIGLLKSAEQYKRRVLLIISLSINLGLLCFFKYFNFFIESFTHAFTLLGQKLTISHLNIILPIGISFYTFKTIGYSIDVYNRRAEPTTNLLTYLNFVSFFPQILAGPIDRANNLLPQFDKLKTFNNEQASDGLRLILFGLFKKMVIADNAAILVNSIYDNPASYVGLPMVVATIFFAFQIYCDFSGYSDIAIGAAKLLGFNLMNNFNKPYFSTSITEFWKRWHISLTSWFRDFVFLPLALSITWRLKSKKVLFIKSDLYIYILASAFTWTLTGLWHGANYTFIVWGGFHCIVLIIEHVFRKVKLKSPVRRLKTIISTGKLIITFSLVCFGWIFFRANSLVDAGYIIQNIFSDINDYSNINLLATKFRGLGLLPADLIRVVIFILLMLCVEFLESRGILKNKIYEKPIFKWSYYYLIIFLIMFWGTDNSAINFIYFQF